ncbi:MAG: DUF1015 domain-containing protein, partial [Candidatus Firestonebacteria bacterium]
MAEIAPFKGFTYNGKKTGKLAGLVTLPYDVISPSMQKAYYKASPYNIIRLEYGKNKGKNRYRSVGETLSGWIAEGILKKELKPAYYILEQSFKFGGRKCKRTGFYALVKAIDFKMKQVLPHEETFPKQKKDRLRLLRACKANLSPIFGVFDGKLDFGALKKNKPDLQYTLKDKGQPVSGKIWKVTCGEETAKLTAFMKNRRIFIADGHHRYETSLDYRKEREEKSGKDSMAPWNYTLFVLVSLQDKGLVIYPTHRVVKFSSPVNIDTLLAVLGADFKISISRREASAEDIVIYLKGIYYALKPKSKKVLSSIPVKKSMAWKALSTSVLHHLIL